MSDRRRLSTPDEILNAALAKEHRALQFYSELAEQCEIEMVRQLIEKLKDEENKHVKMIEEMIAYLRLGHSPV